MKVRSWKFNILTRFLVHQFQLHFSMFLMFHVPAFSRVMLNKVVGYVIYTLNHHHNKSAMQEIAVLGTLAVFDFF